MFLIDRSKKISRDQAFFCVVEIYLWQVFGVSGKACGAQLLSCELLVAVGPHFTTPIYRVIFRKLEIRRQYDAPPLKLVNSTVC